MYMTHEVELTIGNSYYDRIIMIIISFVNICIESSIIFRNSLNSEFHNFVRVKLTLKFGTHIRKIRIVFRQFT